MNVLLTGGAGYIGSHTAIELLAAGHGVVILDNFSNGSSEVVGRVEQIAGTATPVVRADVRDQVAVEVALREHRIDAVIHFAGLKAVGESVAQPLHYYDHNVVGALALLNAMQSVGVRSLVFSSSATVYGDPRYVPIDEVHPLSATNPYGRTKLMVEHMLADLQHADPRWCVTVLRYFNPIGAHESGTIGESPLGVPNNLLPYVAQVAAGVRERVQVFGDDYPTPDGTGVRDYIHVVDLARGHVLALQHQAKAAAGGGHWVFNLGTGTGHSVLEVIRAFEQASGRTVPYVIAARRPGDVATCYAQPERAHAELGWRAQCDLQRMCIDAWRWQNRNPRGYQ